MNKRKKNIPNSNQIQLKNFFSYVNSTSKSWLDLHQNFQVVKVKVRKLGSNVMLVS